MADLHSMAATTARKKRSGLHLGMKAAGMSAFTR
jgi:hypothetical protein